MAQTRKSCPVCGSRSVGVFLEVGEAPAHCNVLWKSRSDAVTARRAAIRLGCCDGCGHVFNTAFDPEAVRYTADYENSLHFSPFFRDYARSLAESLIERHRLYEKDIIEIGCGKGDFLVLLSELGGNRGVGFDASYSDERLGERPDGVTFIKDLYSARYSRYRGDLILSRQVLEHLDAPRSFVAGLRDAMGDASGTVVFFEVPNFLYTIRELAIWDIIYEHFSYFTPTSFRRLFSRGFRVDRVEEGFEGQFLCLEARSAGAALTRPRVERPAVERLRCACSVFSRRYAEKVAAWRAELEQLASLGRRAVVWGGGSKGVSFLNTFRSASAISLVVDINPYKQGRFIPGTGHEIVGPDALEDICPELIIVMNPIYTGEIWDKVRGMGLKCRILSA